MKIPFTNFAVKRFNPMLEKQYADCALATEGVHQRSHLRYHIINALLENTVQKRYLEIGVRNPEDNFDRITADFKVSVDPGVESRVNHATFPLTSDEFFEKLFAGRLKIADSTFDVIFVDGLHLADQVYRDIQNALRVVAHTGSHRVVAALAGQRVVARSAFQHIVAVTALQVVRSGIADNAIVVGVAEAVGTERTGERKVLDILAQCKSPTA